jgi:hypothetical protein
VNLKPTGFGSDGGPTNRGLNARGRGPHDRLHLAVLMRNHGVAILNHLPRTAGEPAQMIAVSVDDLCLGSEGARGRLIPSSTGGRFVWRKTRGPLFTLRRKGAPVDRSKAGRGG